MNIDNRNSVNFTAIKILPTNKWRKAQNIVAKASEQLAAMSANPLAKGDEFTFRLDSLDAEVKIAKELKQEGIKFFHWTKRDISDKDYSLFVQTKFSDLLTQFSYGLMLWDKKVRIKTGMESDSRLSRLPKQSEYKISSAGFEGYSNVVNRVLNIEDNSGHIHLRFPPQWFDLLPD